MSKFGERMIQAAREGRAIARGEADPATYRVFVPSKVDVRKIRCRLKLSQDEFATKFGLSVATVREWEQNRRKPEGPARVLLTIIEREPEAVSRALSVACPAKGPPAFPRQRPTTNDAVRSGRHGRTQPRQ
jgi:putative transcriptional regulator